MMFLYKLEGLDVYATAVSEHAAREAIRLVHGDIPRRLEVLGVAASTDDVFCCPMSAQLIQQKGVSV